LSNRGDCQKAQVRMSSYNLIGVVFEWTISKLVV
jgi:hypothetical protein